MYVFFFLEKKKKSVVIKLKKKKTKIQTPLLWGCVPYLGVDVSHTWGNAMNALVNALGEVYSYIRNKQTGLMV